MQSVRRSASRGAAGRVTAVLGPTNTGKTHLAVERMLGHRSGMIGCPLRLLAREIYDRVARARGAGQVALVTGEERIVPARPRYWVCTVESMPTDRAVEFVAIDEIQLAADPERGHVFTDRMLHARGISETMLLGASTMTRPVRRLVPEAAFVARPRFSALSFAGARKVSRLPPRSVAVAFSVAEVYRAAELLRRLRGGAAVVMGALSPRTRNAQAALYQSGEVDYLVATDAIGMGLNMNVDHVAFAGLGKFDGRRHRDLDAAEIAQIAGRAGRHTRDGSFGTTLDAPPLEPETAAAVERHAFPAVDRIYWRNARLDLSSPAALLRGLEEAPPRPELARPRDADDLASLRALLRDPEIARRAAGYDAVELLWRVCRVPDFRKTVPDAHYRLLAAIYRKLTDSAGVLPEAWVGRMVDRLDRADGDIDMLAARIAHIRTWNYIAWRPGWTADAEGLRARARAIEDKLSDALHARLTGRFIDRRAALLARRLKERSALSAAVRKGGEVLVEGEPVGRLDGFRFVPADAEAWRGGSGLRAAVRRAVEPEIRRRAGALAAAPAAELALRGDGAIVWRGLPVARLVRGAAPLAPGLKVETGDAAPEHLRACVERRLAAWRDGHIARVLAPLLRARRAELRGLARGVAFQVAEALGAVPRGEVAEAWAALDARDRKALAALGIRFGRVAAFMPALLKPEPAALRGLLRSVHDERAPIAPPPPGRVSVPLSGDADAGRYRAIGYWPVGGRAVRLDMLERLAAALARRARAGPVALDSRLANLAGCSGAELAALARDLGYRAVGGAEGAAERYAPARPRGGGRAPRPRRSAAAPGSPFAALARWRGPEA